jgi:hypothetical protein
MNTLARATLFLLVMQVLHLGDHTFNQPSRDLGVQGAAIGALGFLTLFGCLYLATREDPLAPLACAVTGFGTALGFISIHIAPHWSLFSDPYSAFDANGLSWAIVIVSIGAALWLGVVAARMMHEQRAQPAT